MNKQAVPWIGWKASVSEFENCELYHDQPDQKIYPFQSVPSNLHLEQPAYVASAIYYIKCRDEPYMRFETFGHWKITLMTV